MRSEPQTHLPPPRAVAPLQPGSIWPGENGKNMFFTDNKARYVNDIVTIVVSETTTGTSKATTNTARTTSATAGIATLLGLEKTIAEKNAKLATLELGGSTSNSLKGAGDTSRGSTLTARISARVVRVLDNGNLAIEGRRQLTMNAEDQFIMISGIIRTDDITSENLIASQHISDAKIYYVGEGVINDKMRPGWLTRVMDWVWPF
ncbi:MAG: flagellar basal body L-ring protein FlgH [Deltaproteobacteria bacterium]|nr:flagellar basal body L-ring protein FlgH [Deltaproteobacteria bacterium]